jgi:hypothetical protein
MAEEAKIGEQADPVRGTSAPNADTEAEPTRPAKKAKKFARAALATAAALVTLSGAATVIVKIVHSLNSTSPAHTSTDDPSCVRIQRSSTSGLSFYQDAQQDPMAYCNPDDPGGMFTVSMKSKPFELWFPALVGSRAVEVCASTDISLFADAKANPLGATRTCLTPGTGVADAELGGGFLAISTPQEAVHTEIAGSRPQPATDGQQKYYVSTAIGPKTIAFSSFHDRLYLVIAAPDAADPTVISIEKFTLYFER